MPIRRATIHDSEALVRVKRPGPGRPCLALEQQQLRRFALVDEGIAEYLLAERDMEVVGHAFLRLAGTQSGPGYPDIEDLYVRADCRGHGIGSELLAACEAVALQHGFTHVGLSVNPTFNRQALRLYERLGYCDTGRPPHLDGIYAGVTDWCIEMVKSITLSDSPSVFSKNE
jgi:ribosomal protein S18 acetylase RimI-like enzyme